MASQQQQFDARVLIIGGGIGGLTLAAICRKIGISCKVLERTKELTPAGAGISLAPNALRVLDQLGVYRSIVEEGQRLRKIQVHRNRTKWSEIDFQWLEQTFGYPVYSIERHLFHHLLHAAAGGSDTVLLDADVTDIVDDPTQPGVMVKLSDGRSLVGEAVVGADGIRSATRRILARQAGLESVNTIRFTGRVHMSGYTAPLTNLGPAEIGVGNWLLYDNSILTTWPCKDNRQWYIGVKVGADSDVFVVVHHLQRLTLEYDRGCRPLSPSGASQIDQSGKGSTARRLTPSMEITFILLQRRGTSVTSERVIASNVFEETDFPAMAYGRVALLGDAAHSMTSFFGQGACQAIEDATELANVLHRYFTNQQGPEQSSSLGDALQEYRTLREGRARDLVSFSSNYAKVHTARLPYGLGPLVRKFVYAYMPIWGWRWALRWLYGHQPTVEALRGAE
ncbi:hypothetical protein VTN00DRAFT_1092 [Thermoascus crustaceus]|uniref:uncharacterized protein n=1 Tax=Thermoascus crustaceus TaxID=5088 RepID=UPI0037444329